MYAIEVATLTGTVGSLTPDTTNAGDVVWSYDHNGPNSDTKNSNLVYSIASDMTVGDMNNDGYSDIIYVGDTGGRMWRFNISGDNIATWAGDIIFDANFGYLDFYSDYSPGFPSEPISPTLDSNDG